MLLPIVDAHQHFWNLQRNHHPWLCDEPMIPFRYGDYRAIRNNYLPDNYFADAANHDVVKTVYVEAEWNPADPLGETRWIQSVHQLYGVPNAVVAQAWLDRDDVDQVLAAQAAFPLVRSVRHKPRAALSAEQVRRSAEGSIGDPRWRAGFALLSEHGLSFDLQTPYWHLYEAAELAGEFPEIPIILNHTGLPVDRNAEGIAAWRSAMKVFAEVAHTSVKISGLGIRDKPWQVQDNAALVLETIEIFGVERCMFASNFPVDKLVGSFDTIFTGFKTIVQDFSFSDRKKMFHDNAMRIYGI
jgi:predicted TIM-barrel fold metal-dependent hydrolase